MPRVLMPGSDVHGYRVEERLSDGAFAISYRAVQSDGVPVFLKQYKMPTVATPWYRAYISYQEQLKHRIESGRARAFCYRIIDFFEERVGTPCYFQVFEFVEKGMDMQGVLDRMRERPGAIGWGQRLVFAKVFMAGMKALHEARIVHSDLKPENVQLFETPKIEVRYTLKLIDMDWSVLTDVKPPWHGSGDMGIVGTPGYMSPEHLRGRLPVPASDVFTCGLILYELLGGGHPYRGGEELDYGERVLTHRAGPPALAGPVAAPACQDEVERVLHACLNPHPSKRPSAAGVHRALTGEDSAPDPPGTLVLVGPSGEQLAFNVSTEFGRALATRGGGEPEVWSAKQFHLHRSEKGWEVEHTSGATNETLLNGARLRARSPLKANDVIAVGNTSKGVVRSPFKVKRI